MKLINVRIRNFRTIRSEVTFDIESGLTIVGPNNAGKSNILRALRIFFAGPTNNGYRRKVDFPHGAGREKTSMTMSFLPGDGDGDFVKLFNDLRELHPEPPQKSDQVSLNVYFTDTTDKAVYSFFPNVKRPTGTTNATYSRLQSDLLEKIFNKFEVIYIPSDKSYAEVFSEIVSPALVGATSEITKKILPEIATKLSDISEVMNQVLSDSGMRDITTVFQPSESAHAAFMSNVNLNITDQITTEFSRKGTGVQSAAIFSALVWIDQVKRNSGLVPVWLIEEPESYLHPELAGVVNKLLSGLSSSSTVIVTTHSLGFVPTEVERVVGCLTRGNRTVLERYKSYSEATERIRQSLGVRFSDYYNLGILNIGVEGLSDRSVFEDVFYVLMNSGDFEGRWGLLEAAKYVTFQGVSDLGAFLKTTYSIISKECVFVSVFDGDTAGGKVRKELQGFFGNKHVQFTPGIDFISVRSGFALEGLFPDDWISDIYNAKPDYFAEYSVDVEGVLEPFRIDDKHKKAVQNILLKRIDPKSLEWASRFISVFDALEAALAGQRERVFGAGS
ncbi:ATP-dependent nuclease [Maricaulis sp.]|uniref:ATP-dependent nuclease n=1 Tax=Maricaulis sp. TaxID=1486257 RepID=UPI003A8CB920